MRLIKADTIELVKFLPHQTPPYAILSHTWSTNPDDEVLFSDVGKEEAKEKPAYEQKVVLACRKALEHGLNYLLIDTCCIDKSSSAELQEAINSMFKWYSHSSTCLVYLEDVPSERDESTNSEMGHAWIINSRWFTRGWTLQELVAPGTVIFYSKYWKNMGTRASLATLISKRTNIDENVLIDSSPKRSIFSKSVANRMSWAAFRETTRPEDIAYSLLGIFHINMPLLYGEGEEKAFFRLQEQILKSSDDQSLLAWTASPSRKTDVWCLCGPFAKHPIEFRDASRIVSLPGVPDTYSLTSSGLRIGLLVLPCEDDIYFEPPYSNEVWGVLRCHYKDDFTGPLAIKLESQPWEGSYVYARKCAAPTTIDRRKLNGSILTNGPNIAEYQPCLQSQTITIRRSPIGFGPDREHFLLEDWPTGCTLVKAIPKEQWNSKSRIMFTDNYEVTRVLILEHVISRTRCAVVLGFSYRFPEDSLGLVTLVEVGPNVLHIPPWLQKWESNNSIDMSWSEEDFVKNQSSAIAWGKGKGPLQELRATIRRGHIMGVPFFVVNVRIHTNSAASI